MGPVFGVDVDGSSFVGGEFGGDVLEEGFCFGVGGFWWVRWVRRLIAWV